MTGWELPKGSLRPPSLPLAVALPTAASRSTHFALSCDLGSSLHDVLEEGRQGLQFRAFAYLDCIVLQLWGVMGGWGSNHAWHGRHHSLVAALSQKKENRAHSGLD